MSRAHRQAQQQSRVQIKQRICGQCPQCTWRNTPRPISLLFLDKQRTRLPERCLILLKSQELLEESLFVFPTLFTCFLSFFFCWQQSLCRWVPMFHGSLACCFIHFTSCRCLCIFFKSITFFYSSPQVVYSDYA